ncbi:MAG: AI-2E family transporter [Gemmatimonadota bacterium]
MGEDAARANRILFNLAAFVVIVAGLRAASTLLVPFLLAMFLAVLCATPLRWLTDHKVPRVVAVLLLVIIILALGTVVGGLLTTTIVDLTRQSPRYEAGFQEEMAGLIATLERLGMPVSAQTLTEYFDPSRLFGMTRTLVTSVGQVLANGALILLTMVFALLEMSSFPLKIRAAFGDSDAHHAEESMNSIGLSIRRYVALKTVISLGTGVGIYLWLMFLGVDYAILWGVVAFLLNYIPNIGSFIAAIPAVLLAFIQLGLGSAIVAALGFLIVNVVFANLLEPRVMGYGVGLSTLVVFVSLVFWGWILGPVGMLLSVPLTVIFRIVMETNDSTRWIAILLGSDRSLDPIITVSPRETIMP